MKHPRSVALAKGRKFYSAEPCQKDGHGLQRYASNGCCVDCCKERSRVQAQKWRQIVRMAREAGLA